MTYGEQWFLQKQAIDLKSDVEGCGSPSNNLPPKMSRDEASKYYNTKFFNYWLTQFDEDIDTKKHIAFLKFLMFGRTENVKLLLEEITACGN
ncbi:MAG: hypothetical protein NTW78_04010 [Campylobacterales bacterium]|nr:hypothetical protein [Campylobacterales bacterium]